MPSHPSEIRFLFENRGSPLRTSGFSATNFACGHPRCYRGAEPWFPTAAPLRRRRVRSCRIDASTRNEGDNDVRDSITEDGSRARGIDPYSDGRSASPRARRNAGIGFGDSTAVPGPDWEVQRAVRVYWPQLAGDPAGHNTRIGYARVLKADLSGRQEWRSSRPFRRTTDLRQPTSAWRWHPIGRGRRREKKEGFPSRRSTMRPRRPRYRRVSN